MAKNRLTRRERQERRAAIREIAFVSFVTVFILFVLALAFLPQVTCPYVDRGNLCDDYAIVLPDMN